jgi:hypothetical protein
MMTPSQPSGRSLAQRLAVQMQVHLPGTVGRLLKQIRDLEQIAPVFVRTGLVRPIERPVALTVQAAGIATRAVAGRVTGGFLYAAAAARTDVRVEDNVLATVGQDSACEIDDIDFEDQSKRFQLINVRQAYQLADAALRSPSRFDLILLDSPLVLNRSMVPPGDELAYAGYRAAYERAMEAISRFWEQHRERLFPWNRQGTVVAGLASERFGAIVEIAQQDLRTPEGRVQVLATERVDAEGLRTVLGTEQVIAGVGQRRFVNGILGHYARTAAFRMNVRTPRMEPADVVGRGVLGFHYRAGTGTPPRLVQLVGDEPDWQREDLDRLAGLVAGLTVVGGPRAAPVPIQLASREQEALERFLRSYTAAVHQGMEKKEVEDVWLSGLDEFS